MMNVCLCRSLIVGVSFCFSSAVYCQSWFDSVSVGAGTSFDHGFLAHIGIQHNFDKQWWESDAGSLSAYLDLSLNNWSLSGKDDLRIVAISPVFTYQFSTRLFGAKPNLECGIGGSYISEYVFNDRDMGGKFQFEDRLKSVWLRSAYDCRYLDPHLPISTIFILIPSPISDTMP
ncbi:acyloxyacyl hydrolase, partial [Vibrio fluvialis]|uniref:acyloxyacyl hydrolase n=1 Tax=Vibrio fluvialis TaxID=676 RepID=UPI001EEA70D4